MDTFPRCGGFGACAGSDDRSLDMNRLPISDDPLRSLHPTAVVVLKESNGGGGNPDLFFNRAHVFHYREDYPEAVRDYRC